MSAGFEAVGASHSGPCPTLRRNDTTGLILTKLRSTQSHVETPCIRCRAVTTALKKHGLSWVELRSNWGVHAVGSREVASYLAIFCHVLDFIRPGDAFGLRSGLFKSTNVLGAVLRQNLYGSLANIKIKC